VVTVTEIRARCRRLKRLRGLDLVVVDYLQLMQGANRENRQQEIADISRGLKNLARELAVPIIAVSQLNRALESREDKRPRLSDLRESGCLTGDTMVVRADTNERIRLDDLAASGVTNVPVWTLDEHFRLIRGTMTRAFSSGSKPVFEMLFASGKRLKASANHPFLTVTGWKPFEDLRVGDHLATARRLYQSGAYQDLDVIPAEVWEYVRTKAMPEAGVTSRQLANRLGISYRGSDLFTSGVSRGKMARIAEALNDDTLWDLALSDVCWGRIVAIEPLGIEPVYDATVAGTHNFIGNGIVAHNSIEQDADVVMFIYRHEYYHPEDMEKKGMAEVIIAKHRAGGTGSIDMTFLPDFTRFADLGRDVS
jgi:replicative DNA helicase